MIECKAEILCYRDSVLSILHARIPGLHLIAWHSHFCVDLLNSANPADRIQGKVPKETGTLRYQ